MTSSTSHKKPELSIAEKERTPDALAFAELEMALGSLAKVDVPDDLQYAILARVSGESGFLGLGRKQWMWASLSFGAWMLLTQGMFSWVLGGVSAL